MNKYTITKSKFLEYYFEDGQDQENDDLKRDLAERVIVKLQERGEATITVEEIFNECSKEAIRISYLEEFPNSSSAYDIEFGELKNSKLELID